MWRNVAIKSSGSRISPATTLRGGSSLAELCGDAVHFQSNWEGRIVPGFNFDQAKSATSMARMADIPAKEHGEIWINHDKPQRESLKLAPAFYE
jgi:hypothetical protein